MADIRWNSNDTFVGTVVGAMPPPPSYKNPDTRSLLFRTFLAAPLLELRGATERKFSGNEVAGQNTDDDGAVIDAFAHSVLVDSQETILLVDLQGIVIKFTVNSYNVYFSFVGIINQAGEIILYDPQAHT
jgi:hypothetical protein